MISSVLRPNLTEPFPCSLCLSVLAPLISSWWYLVIQLTNVTHCDQLWPTCDVTLVTKICFCKGKDFTLSVFLQYFNIPQLLLSSRLIWRYGKLYADWVQDYTLSAQSQYFEIICSTNQLDYVNVSLQLFEWVVLSIPPKLTAHPGIPQIRFLNDIQYNVCIKKMLKLISMKTLKARSSSNQSCALGCGTRKVVRNV